MKGYFMTKNSFVAEVTFSNISKSSAMLMWWILYRVYMFKVNNRHTRRMSIGIIQAFVLLFWKSKTSLTVLVIVLNNSRLLGFWYEWILLGNQWHCQEVVVDMIFMRIDLALSRKFKRVFLSKQMHSQSQQ